ncbi:ribonuclease HII [Candidatus Pacearchaeota archaeon]|nr:ribonuclease HII [Candidatus Pacearchaeota archaeon]
MSKLIGIDDAGRGPVLGPMVLVGVLVESNEEQMIKDWGAKDSKLLTSIQRRELKEKIVSQFEYHIEVSEPIEIDESDNLNYLEAIKTAMIINRLTKDLDEPVKVVIDCPSVNISSWSNDVQKLIEKQELVSLVCEHKADLNHPVVSAASIIAKEKREDEMGKLRKEFGKDFGSGYPADPKTKEFIRDNFNNPRYKKIIRFSWNTVKRLVKEKNQQSLFQ